MVATPPVLTLPSTAVCTWVDAQAVPTKKPASAGFLLPIQLALNGVDEV
jgi:hypothetical protein